ncbi:MAG TPA: DUF979 family protein [Caulobacteraceae bacterium]|jgi:uncharacterized membrane protein|nr:DUF979 family protein [Caulobacteraceae bacterium]
MIGLPLVFSLAGVVFAIVAVASLLERGAPRRWAAGAFWALLATTFLFGGRLDDVANGVVVLGIVAAGVFMRPPRAAPAAQAPRGGLAIFLPVLAVPVVTLAGSALLSRIKVGGSPLVPAAQATVVSLALGALAGFVLAVAIARPPLLAPAREARRLMNQVGSAAVLPQLLAALGGVFALAGVGGAVQKLLGLAIPLDSGAIVVAAFCGGMALFTMVMGNAFAAFPVMVAALGAPLIVGRFGGDAALMGAVGMLSGFCGTLMTPMASFNIVPAALMELKIGSVIRVQAPTAIAVLIANMLLLGVLALRHL